MIKRVLILLGFFLVVFPLHAVADPIFENKCQTSIVIERTIPPGGTTSFGIGASDYDTLRLEISGDSVRYDINGEYYGDDAIIGTSDAVIWIRDRTVTTSFFFKNTHFTTAHVTFTFQRTLKSSRKSGVLCAQ